VSGVADKTPAAQNITSLKVSGGGKRVRYLATLLRAALRWFELVVALAARPRRSAALLAATSAPRD
jgi:hypothetical protein